jgi:hypothetical protein
MGKNNKNKIMLRKGRINLIEVNEPVLDAKTEQHPIKPILDLFNYIIIKQKLV